MHPLFHTLKFLRQRHRALVGALLAALIAQSAVTAQATSGADYRELKAQMRKDLVAVILPQKRSTRAELLALEKRLAAAADFSGAINARDSRVALEQEILALEREEIVLANKMLDDNGGKIDLALGEAQLKGVTFDPKDGTLRGWNAPGASVTWTLPDLPPGGYEILLKHQGTAASFTVHESFYMLRSELPAAKAPVESNLGTLKIRDGKGMLVLTPNSGEIPVDLRVYSVSLQSAAR